jgi:hypothetical protein
MISASAALIRRAAAATPRTPARKSRYFIRGTMRGARGAGVQTEASRSAKDRLAIREPRAARPPERPGSARSARIRGSSEGGNRWLAVDRNYSGNTVGRSNQDRRRGLPPVCGSGRRRRAGSRPCRSAAVPPRAVGCMRKRRTRRTEEAGGWRRRSATAAARRAKAAARNGPDLALATANPGR